MSILDSRKVAVAHGEGVRYPSSPPYHPAASYPEYPFGDSALSGEKNEVYGLVRECLRCLGLDAGRFGTRDWNPLGDLIRPGHTVVLKPNWVLHEHERGGDLDCVITHSSVLRAVADYVLIALRGEGKMVFADAPLPNADFQRLMRAAQVPLVAGFLSSRSGIPVEIRDLRKIQHVYTPDEILGSDSRVALSGDPEGYVTVDLADQSEFAPLGDVSRLYGADYDRKETVLHHSASRHEYLISGTVLKADVVVSLPKIKVHRKVGATLNLKNLVGINGDKNYLPHFQIGAPSGGGDEFPDSIGSTAKTVYGIRRRMVDTFLLSRNPALEKAYVLARRGFHAVKRPLGIPAEIVQAGDWFGNDTAWRMVLDLNKILHYAQADGTMTDSPQRRFFSLLDGIVAGEGEGPLVPDARSCGVLVAGGNPLATDLAALRLMGLDWSRLKLYRSAVDLARKPLFPGGPSAVEWVGNDEALLGKARSASDRILALRPPRGWVGHCEIEEQTKEKVG